MLSPRYDAARTDFERVLKQRNALLRGGVRDDEARSTLDVFDEQLVHAATELIRGRLRLTERLAPAIGASYAVLATESSPIETVYETEWSAAPLVSEDTDAIEQGLRDAIASKRRAEIDRGVTLVGPHRDEWRLQLGGLDARTQASQGEQRTLALALRLAGHGVVSELTGATPVLLLDDVFSELDHDRATALVRNLPPGQTLLTTAGTLPEGVHPERRIRVHAGRIEAADA
jgi:DNA replication and repair protein RecF